MANLYRQTAVADVNGDATFYAPLNRQACVYRVESVAPFVATEVEFQYDGGATQAHPISSPGADVFVSFAPGALGVATVVKCPAGAAGATIALTWRVNPSGARWAG